MNKLKIATGSILLALMTFMVGSLRAASAIEFDVGRVLTDIFSSLFNDLFTLILFLFVVGMIFLIVKPPQWIKDIFNM